MIFPKVTKKFGRLASVKKLSRGTMKVIGAALVAAGISLSNAPDGHASVPPDRVSISSNVSGRVIVLPLAPVVTITDGTTILANHYSHSSHASHVSHGSHCSGYSYC